MPYFQTSHQWSVFDVAKLNVVIIYSFLLKQISGHYSLEDRHLGRLYFGILKLNKEYSF